VLGGAGGMCRARGAAAAEKLLAKAPIKALCKARDLALVRGGIATHQNVVVVYYKYLVTACDKLARVG